MTDKLHDIVNQAADRLPEALATLIFGLIVVEIVIFLAGKFLRVARLQPGLQRVVFSLLRAFLFVILFVSVLQSLGLNNIFVAITGGGVIAAVLISAGVAPLISDVLAGLFLGADNKFQPGAKVIAGDQQTEGVIESMDIRKVHIRDKKGFLHVLPSSVVEKNEWVILKSRTEPKPKAKASRRAR